MVKFPTWIPDCDSHSPALLDLLLSSDTSICSTMTLPPLGNSDQIVVSVCIDFPSNSKRDLLFHCIADDYSCVDWDILCDLLRDVTWEDIFKLGAFAPSSEFCEWVQVVIDVYIPHCKYHIKSHSSPWFSADWATAINHRNHIFCLHKQNESPEFKVNFRQAGNCCKRVLETAKLAYANKTKESITSLKLGSQDFWQIAIVFSAKVKVLLYLLYSSTQTCCLLHPIKHSCLLKPFLRTLILMIQVFLYPFSLLKLI